jgi:predicted nucleotidyltransferase
VTRPPAPDAARALVAERFPNAVQAWLAGSTTTGRATETSDLDITVLCDEGDVFRASEEYAVGRSSCSCTPLRRWSTSS